MSASPTMENPGGKSGGDTKRVSGGIEGLKTQRPLRRECGETSSGALYPGSHFPFARRATVKESQRIPLLEKNTKRAGTQMIWVTKVVKARWPGGYGCLLGKGVIGGGGFCGRATRSRAGQVGHAGKIGLGREVGN